MARPKASTVALRDKKYTDRVQKEPLEIKFAEDSPAVAKVREEMEGLLPHELLMRTSKGMPSIVTFPHCEMVGTNGDFIITQIPKLIFPTLQEQMKAQSDAASYTSPKLQAVQKQSKKKVVHQVMEVPAINADDWEQAAIESQQDLQDKAKKLVE